MRVAFLLMLFFSFLSIAKTSWITPWSSDLYNALAGCSLKTDIFFPPVMHKAVPGYCGGPAPEAGWLVST